MKTIYKNLFSLLGVNVGYAVAKEDVVSFIKTLRPQNTNFKLIRLGQDGDGGYLVPDDLENIKACFSPGVDLVSDFELECYNRGMQIFMADRSVDKPKLKISEVEYNFIKKFIGTINNEDLITMDKWISSANLNTNSDLLLQMDIEGHEYSTILSMSNQLVERFRIIVIEFHDLNKIWNKEFFRLAQSVFLKILDTHVCVHIHPNNCCGVDKRRGVEIPRAAEFTFISKDRITYSSDATIFPHKLDFDNTDNKSIVLPEVWYKQSS